MKPYRVAYRHDFWSDYWLVSFFDTPIARFTSCADAMNFIALAIKQGPIQVETTRPREPMARAS